MGKHMGCACCGNTQRVLHEILVDNKPRNICAACIELARQGKLKNLELIASAA